MGLILDTSVLIDADRNGLDVVDLLNGLRFPQTEKIAISSITLIEFANGISRALTPERAAVRRQFLIELEALISVVAFGADLAFRAGLLNGELKKKGISVGILDLMIGVTALRAGFPVVTRNIKHFRLIPDLNVIEG